MKFNYIYALLLACVYSGTAQAQFESYFGESQTSWKLANTFVTPETGSIDSLAYTGDTLYEGKLYKRFELWSYVVPYNLEPGSIWYQGGEYFDSSMRVLMRESSGADSLFRVSYYDDGFPPEAEQLISVMGLELGDNFMGMPVLSITTDDEGRKVIDVDTGFYTQRLVEGLGPLVFFQESTWSAVLCQLKDEELNYLTDDEDYAPFCLGNPLSSAPASLDDLGWRAFPNPFAEALHIALPHSMSGSYTLYDVLGKVHLAGSLDAQSVALSTQHLPKGMYLLHVRQGQQAAVRKLVKD
jgi:hypothetical protein